MLVNTKIIWNDLSIEKNGDVWEGLWVMISCMHKMCVRYLMVTIVRLLAMAHTPPPQSRHIWYDTIHRHRGLTIAVIGCDRLWWGCTITCESIGSKLNSGFSNLPPINKDGYLFYGLFECRFEESYEKIQMFNRAKFVDQSNHSKDKSKQCHCKAYEYYGEKKAAINIIVGLGVGREETYYHGEMVVAFNKDQWCMYVLELILFECIRYTIILCGSSLLKDRALL